MIAFRPADLRTAGERTDRGFIVSTWSSSFKTAHAAGLITAEDWADVMHVQLGKILDRPDARAIMAFDRDDPDFLYGWIAGETCGRDPVVWYVYVKEPFRRAGYENGVRIGDGCARQLFAALGVDPTRPFLYACKTPACSKLADKIPRARWNPLVARYPNEQRKETKPWQQRK